MEWWFTNVHSQYRKIDKGNPELVVQTDSSLSGWGFVCNGEKSGGRWTKEEKTMHINGLELKAILFALKALGKHIKNKHVKILSDSMTAVHYVTNFGGCRSVDCNQISRDIWLWCIEHNVWLSCTHIAGKLNEADGPSRHFNDKLEWSLNEEIFGKICSTWRKPTIDLFASRLNKKIDCYCSFQPDPGASYINAFTLDWGDLFDCGYVFPPFSMISRCIGKIRTDRAQAIVVVPLWPTQTWFPALMNILVDYPRIIPRKNRLLTLPHREQEHPLAKKLILIACLVSGIPSEIEAFQEKLQVYSSHHGECPLETNTSHIFQNGYRSVVNGRLVKYLLL